VVTVVKLKKDLIEFQLGGGGFGTFGDDTSTSVNIPLLEKSDREKRLEQRIEEEDDRHRRRDLQKELEDVRDRRERENRRIMVERAVAEEQKRARVAAERLRGGSRFNLRYSGRVPPGMSPEDVMTALSDYLDFAASWPGFDREAADLALRKGMLRSEVDGVFGTPVRSSERREGSLHLTTVVFLADGRRVSADFVEDVLVRYTIIPR
jgi:hypothetical protein